MAKNDNYEINDSLWGRTTQYASAVWDSWSKDVDEYVEDVMDTDSRSDEELYGSTVLQDSAHSVELVAHLVGSVFSNDYTKERVKELGSAIASTDAYQSSTENIHKLETTLTQATEQFMKEHPKVQTAFMATEDKLEEVKAYVTKEAHTFAKNNPEITNDVKAVLEIAMTVPAAKVGKIAVEARELSKLNKLDYTHPQGKELAKGISSVDRKSLNLEELAVTAEAKVGKETLFDTNQQARGQAHSTTSTLAHDEIQAKEAKNIAKVERKIERKEKEGNPLTEKEKAEEFYKASKPNATLAQSHAETAVIQRAYEQGLTKDADMFIKVNGKAVCGHCNSDTIKMAQESGLKSITIHDYNIDNTQRIADGKKPLGPIIHWNKEIGKDRYDSFEELENKVKNMPKAPDYIKHAGVIEAERTSMNSMDMVLLGTGGAVLMNESISESNTSEQNTQEQEPFDPTTHAQNLINNLYPHLAPTQRSSESTREFYQEETINSHTSTQANEHTIQEDNQREEESYNFSPKLQDYLDQFAPQNTQGYENNTSNDYGYGD